MQFIQTTLKGRGAAHNPANRFESLHVLPDPEGYDAEAGEQPPPQTAYLRDASKSIIATNDSPDVPFRQSVNPYRGCSHGWIYSSIIPHSLGFST